MGQQENTPVGCSKRPDFSPAQPWRAKARLVLGKAAASEGVEAYPLGYAEGLNDARTLLADFMSSPLVLEPIRVYASYKATGTSEN